MFQVKTAEEVKGALRSKSNRYGNFEMPYIIAVNVVNDDFGRHEHVLEALFGEECVRCRRRVDGSLYSWPDRKTNGAWRGPNGYKMKNVSGLILTFGLSPFTIHKTEPVLYHHPSPHFSLPIALWPLNQYWVKQDNIHLLPGVAASEVLGLSQWPRD